MPIYEYRCEQCGHRFEVFQRLGADAQGLTCPKCGAEQVRKLLSTFANATRGASPSFSSSAGSCGFS